MCRIEEKAVMESTREHMLDTVARPLFFGTREDVNYAYRSINLQLVASNHTI